MNIFGEKYKCINDLIVAQEKMCKFRKQKCAIIENVDKNEWGDILNSKIDEIILR